MATANTLCLECDELNVTVNVQNGMCPDCDDGSTDDGKNCWDCGDPNEDFMGMNMCSACKHTICSECERSHREGRLADGLMCPTTRGTETPRVI